MKKIYFENRIIVISSFEEQIPDGPDSSVTDATDATCIKPLIEKFLNDGSPRILVLRGKSEDNVYKVACTCFKEVNAGGGLVTRANGDYLFIRRFSHWDLPKGHQESGETISVTAAREVREETGADNLDIGRLICVTDHCYRREGIWHLKHTWWYEMSLAGNSEIRPQLEEDITEAVWVSPRDIQKYLADTFPSIREVCETYFKIVRIEGIDSIFHSI